MKKNYNRYLTLYLFFFIVDTSFGQQLMPSPLLTSSMSTKTAQRKITDTRTTSTWENHETTTLGSCTQHKMADCPMKSKNKSNRSTNDSFLQPDFHITTSFQNIIVPTSTRNNSQNQDSNHQNFKEIRAFYIKMEILHNVGTNANAIQNDTSKNNGHNYDNIYFQPIYSPSLTKYHDDNHTTIFNSKYYSIDLENSIPLQVHFSEPLASPSKLSLPLRRLQIVPNRNGEAILAIEIPSVYAQNSLQEFLHIVLNLEIKLFEHLEGTPLRKYIVTAPNSKSFMKSNSIEWNKADILLHLSKSLVIQSIYNLRHFQKKEDYKLDLPISSETIYSQANNNQHDFFLDLMRNSFHETTVLIPLFTLKSYLKKLSKKIRRHGYSHNDILKQTYYKIHNVLAYEDIVVPILEIHIWMNLFAKTASYFKTLSDSVVFNLCLDIQSLLLQSKMNNCPSCIIYSNMIKARQVQTNASPSSTTFLEWMLLPSVIKVSTNFNEFSRRTILRKRSVSGIDLERQPKVKDSLTTMSATITIGSAKPTSGLEFGALYASKEKQEKNPTQDCEKYDPDNGKQTAKSSSHSRSPNPTDETVHEYPRQSLITKTNSLPPSITPSADAYLKYKNSDILRSFKVLVYIVVFYFIGMLAFVDILLPTKPLFELVLKKAMD